MPGLPKNPHALDRLQFLSSVGQQLLLVGGDPVHAYSIDITKRLRQCRTADKIGRTGLKLIRKLIEDRLLERHGSDHLTSALIRWQLLEPFLLTVKHADSGRTIDLMPGKNIELRIEILHVDRHMRHGLRTIYQYRHAMLMSDSDDLFHRIDRAEHVGDVCD